MDKPLTKGSVSGVLILSALLLGVFAYFGFRYHHGEGGTFPFFGTATAWVEGKLGAVCGGID